MKLKKIKLGSTKLLILASCMAISTTAFAGSRSPGHTQTQEIVVSARVIEVTPITREVRVSTPVKECWQEPVSYRESRRHGSGSAGDVLAGGLIGGIIGHQLGSGRGQKLATAVGTMIGAQLGHDANRGSHVSSQSSYTRYENVCEVQQHVSFEEVVDSYKVKYRYKGKLYQTYMPHDPGETIKLKISMQAVF